MHINKQIWIPATIVALAIVAIIAVGLNVEKVVLSDDSKAGFGTGGVAEDSGRGSISYPIPEPMPPVDGSGVEAGEHIIKTGNLDIRVSNIEQAIIDLDTIAKNYGGEILSRAVSTYQDETVGSVTLRVDETHFEAAMAEIKATASFVASENVSTEDVTAAVIDIEARLRNALAEEASYVALLNRASTVEEIVLVQSYLSQVRGTIESYEAQLDYYASKTTYSIIRVSLTEEASVQFESSGFRPYQAVIDAAQTVVELVQDLLIGVIYIIIIGGAIGIPVGLITWAISRLIRHDGKKRK